MKTNSKIRHRDSLERERDELRAEASEWKRRHDNAVDMLHASEEERSALKAEVERLKAACAKEFEDVQRLDAENMRLKADKAIDAAMKGGA